MSKIRFPSSTTTALYAARRSVRYDDDEDDHEEYGHNEEIAMLELYSQTARGEALLVHAVVDDQQVEVLIFKVTITSDFMGIHYNLMKYIAINFFRVQ